MKKVLSILLVLILSVGLFAGCGGSSNETSYYFKDNMIVLPNFKI